MADGASKFGSAVKTGTTALVDGSKAAVNTVGAITKTIVNNGGDYKYDKTVPLTVKPPGLVDSVFGSGNSLLLFNATKESKSGAASGAIALYCVDCGVDGQATVGGEFGYSVIPPKLTKLVVGVQGSITAQVNLGLHAQAEYSTTYKKTLITQAIPNAGISIGDLGTIGAFIQLDASADFKARAEGQVLVGASASIPDFKATLDAFGGTSGASGFTPKFTRTFNASGEIDVSLGLGMPLEIAVGVKIPKADFTKQLGLRNTPEIVANLNIKASTDTTNTDKCNNGIAWSLGVKNSVDLDLFGDTKNLATFDKPDLFGGCYQFGAKANTTSTTDSTTASDTTATNTGTTIAQTTTTGTATGTTTGKTTTTATTAKTTTTNNKALPTTTATAKTTTSPATTKKTTTTTQKTTTKATKTKPKREYATSFAGLGARDDASDDASDESYVDTPDAADDASIFSAINGTASDSYSDLTNANNATSNDLNDISGDSSISYISLLDASGQYCLANDENGNFFLDVASAASQWTYASYNGEVVLGDGSNFFFTYYPDEMTTLGVSRFRLNDGDSFPTKADWITLTPINYDDSSSTPGVFVALDSQFNAYYPMLCEIEALGTKIFLVNDLTTGAATLQDPNLQSVITGGPTSNCVPISLVSTGAGI